MNDINTVRPNMHALKDFISEQQINIMAHLARNSEEADHFIGKFDEMANIVKNMPKTYETDGVEMDDKVIALHYFYGNCDWYIIEKDMEADEPQYQAFGIADIGFGLSGGGYISIDEIITTTPAEIDLFWTPCTVAELKAKRN